MGSLASTSSALCRPTAQASARPAAPGGRRVALIGSRSSRSSQAAALRAPARAVPRGTNAIRSRGSIVVAAAGEKTWEVHVTCVAMVDEDEDHAGSYLTLTVLDKDSDAKSAEISLDNVKWENKPKEGITGLAKGWSRKGQITVPAALGTPGAVLITKKLSPKAKEAEKDFITSVTFKSETGIVTEIHAESWITTDDGPRVFFAPNTTSLPQSVPPALAALRAKELEILKGNGKAFPTKKTDRIYGYQGYDDLGTPELPRIPLGGEKKPYPRHLANLQPDPSKPGPGLPYLPLDEEFSYSKEQTFKGDSAYYALSSLVASLVDKMKVGSGSSFKSFKEIIDIYRNDGKGGWNLKPEEIKEAPLTGAKSAAEAGEVGKLAVVGYLAKKAASSVVNAIKGEGNEFKFELPRVVANRGDYWETDEEFGRQYLAGQNPCTISALKVLPESFGSAIRPSHVDAELKALGGTDLATLVAQAAAGGKPRVFLADYWVMDVMWDKDTYDVPDRCEHVARVVFFLKQEDGRDTGLIPVAIEIKHKKTHELEKAAGRDLPKSAGIVYSRHELAHDPKKKNLWKLAKIIVKSCDAAVHTVVHHNLRSHAAVEPFVISTHRNISAMHPVYKLMLPHYRFTLNINMNARLKLTKAGGAVEGSFTPAEMCMQIGSAAYAALWRFRNEALPVELRSRGMLDAEGKPWTDYPFASDGLDMWNAIKEYFSSYLKVYYKKDADVLADKEIQAFWKEVKTVGHGDITNFVEKDEVKAWGFAGPIPTIDHLTNILTTVAWAASGHHAAINYGAYDYSGIVLNSSSATRRPIPRPTDVNDPAYKALVEAPNQAKVEEELLTYMADRKTALRYLVFMQLLSMHAEDEVFLDQPNKWLTDPAAKAANAKFIARLKELEQKFEERNQDPSNWTRYAGRKESLSYNLLMASSPPGLTSRGVPYSITI